MADRKKVLSAKELQTIHKATLDILQNTGVAFKYPQALDIFKQHGFKVDGQTVYITETQFDAALASVPQQFTLHGRAEGKDVIMGGEHLALAPGYGSPDIIEDDGSKREALLSDYENFCKLVHTSDVLNITGTIMCEPNDVPTEASHRYQVFSNLTLCDKPSLGSSVSQQAANDSYRMAAIAFGGEAAIKDKPVILAIISSLSPLQYSEEMAGALIEYARNGQAVMVGGLMMAGATGPVRLPGMMVLQNAEFMAGIILAQLIRPGLPCIYGGTSTVTDMRTGALAIGAPEMHLMQNLQAQIAAYYNMPCRGSGGVSDSFCTDYQAGAESALALMNTIEAGSNFILHSCGILGGYLAMSYSKFIADEEVLRMVGRILAPQVIDEQTIDLASIKEIGIGGEYLTHVSTFQNFRKEFHQTAIMQRGYYANWQTGGGLHLHERAAAKAQERIESYQGIDMDPAIVKDLKKLL
jgi:trimethylamine--corrinoid protein Co-methyltransferase